MTLLQCYLPLIRYCYHLLTWMFHFRVGISLCSFDLLRSNLDVAVQSAHQFFLLRYLSLFYPFIKGSSFSPQTTQMSCCQDISFFLSFLQRTLQIFSGNTVACAFFLDQESFYSWDVYLFWAPFCHCFYKSKSVLPPTHVPRV